MKKIIILILIILIIGVGIFLLKPKEEKTKKIKQTTQTNETLTEDQVIDNILISNISLATKNDKTTFSAKITNLTANEVEYKNIQIKIKNKNNDIASLICYFGGNLKSEETKTITAETNANIKNADKIKFELQN